MAPWAGLLLPRQLLNARDMPRYSSCFRRVRLALLGVICLDTDSHEARPDSLELLMVLRSDRFGERIPELLENEEQLLWSDAAFFRFSRYSLQQGGEFRGWSFWFLQLLGECCS
jgi:hypothetical protein